MFTVGFGPYQLLCLYDGLPGMLAEYVNRAALAEQIDIPNPEGKFCFVALKRASDDWPSLVVAQRYLPANGVFFPGALLVRETNRLFIGAGNRLLCYDFARPARLWEDSAECAFWSWTHDETEVFMAAELELAAFDASGTKLWTRFVEPPWDFELEPDHIVLDVMGSITHLDRASAKLYNQPSQRTGRAPRIVVTQELVASARPTAGTSVVLPHPLSPLPLHLLVGPARGERRGAALAHGVVAIDAQLLADRQGPPTTLSPACGRELETISVEAAA